jgi:hypothetical protein
MKIGISVSALPGWRRQDDAIEVLFHPLAQARATRGTYELQLDPADAWINVRETGRIQRANDVTHRTAGCQLHLYIAGGISARKRDAPTRGDRVLHCRTHIGGPQPNVLNPFAVLFEKVQVRCATFQDLNELERLARCATEGKLQSRVRAAGIPRDALRTHLVFSPVVDAQHALVALRDRIQVAHDESYVIGEQVARRGSHVARIRTPDWP